ncbi:MAG: hypothetical protein WD988_05015 [Candidatus Curtissbacteria bacterium]
MHKARILLILGIWVAVLPYLGFPSSWKNILFSLTGLGLVFFSYVIFKESRVNKPPEETFDNFSENKFKEREEQH